MLKKIIDAITTHRSFALVTHHNPDGDAAGAMVSLGTYLRDLGKEVRCYYSGHLMSIYSFLATDMILEKYEETEDAGKAISNVDAIILLDANDWNRTDKMERVLKESPALKMVIDHHPLEGNDSSEKWIDQSASSVGEMIFHLIEEMGGRITEKIGAALYVSILTDTGSFRFSNTTARTHYIASKLIEAGVKTSEIYQKIYERNPIEKVRLLGHCLAHINTDCHKLFAWTTVSRETMKRYHAVEWMLDGVVEVIRTITEVEVTALIREIDDKTVKVSFRSRDKLDVNNLARTLGGGGHPRASGCKLAMGLREAEKLVVEKVREALKE